MNNSFYFFFIYFYGDIMEELYLFENNIDIEEVKYKFIEALTKSKIYQNEFVVENLIIEAKYIIYPFIHGKIKNINYFIVKGINEKNGVIDGEYSYINNAFLLNELKTDNFTTTNKTLDEFDIINLEVIEKDFDKFLCKLNEKLEKGICDRHNLRISVKENKLDIAVIKEFDILKKQYYLEQVYEITYLDSKKKIFKSIYSPLKDEFYKLDFMFNESFKEYLKNYKRPIVSIPKEYYLDYYRLSFEIYSKVKEELNYITEERLYIKAKENIKYKKNVQYYDYLDKLIFFYKRNKYLSLYENKYQSLKSKIFYYYLTLKHISESGYSLAMLVKLGIIDDDYIKLLEISAKLGNLEAQKSLIEYYNSPKNYNENKLKRYI